MSTDAETAERLRVLVITEDGPENITGYPYGPAFNVVG